MCQKSTKPRPSVETGGFLDEDFPLSKPSGILGHSHRYIKSINVRSFWSFEACIDGSDSNERCLGLQFHGPNGDFILGEWRLDKKIEREKLPTATVLVNRRQSDRSFVCTRSAEDDAESIKIEGVLEWWIGLRGSEVISCPL